MISICFESSLVRRFPTFPPLRQPSPPPPSLLSRPSPFFLLFSLYLPLYLLSVFFLLIRSPCRETTRTPGQQIRDLFSQTESFHYSSPPTSSPAKQTTLFSPSSMLIPHPTPLTSLFLGQTYPYCSPWSYPLASSPTRPRLAILFSGRLAQSPTAYRSPNPKLAGTARFPSPPPAAKHFHCSTRSICAFVLPHRSRFFRSCY